MPLGGVLGATRVGATVGMNAGRTSNYARHGSGLRSGKPSASAQAQDAGLEEGIQRAMRGAEAARAASGASPNPYTPPSPAAATDPMKDVGKLGGGTMGLRPDFTARDEAQRAYERVAANPPGWLERQFDGDAGYYDRLRALQQKRDWAEKKAIEDAMQARASDPRYETWTDTNDTDEQGRRLQTSSQDPNRTRVKTFEETYREEMEGPTRPGEDTPAREMTRRRDVYDPTIAEIRARAAEDQKKSDRDFAEAMALNEAGHYARLQENSAQAAARKDAALSGVSAREGSQKRVAEYKAGLKPEAEAAPRDVRADYDQLVRKKAGVQSAAGFDALPPEERAAAIKAADDEMASRPTRDSLGGRKVGPVVAAPQFKKGDVYRGRKFLGGDPNDIKSWGPPAGGGR